MVAVVAVAYGTAAPALGVAEFAPAARQAVDAPPTTAGSHATGGSGAAGRRATTTSTAAPTTDTASGSQTAAPSTTQVARSRRCYGDPPRQIEDPMSPPCLGTIFEGDNGGATSPGVSATEIRIGVPGLGQSATDGFNITINTLFEFFNQSFELYGRRLVPVFVSGPFNTAANARATAADAAAQGIFGGLTAYAEWLNGQSAMAAELARRQVVTVARNSSAWWTDRTLFDPMHPYVWSVNPSAEDIQANLAGFSCQSLAGRPAMHAGDPALNGKVRRFGIAAFGYETSPNVGQLARALEACTGDPPEIVTSTYANRTTDGRTGLEKLRARGVTTAICACEGIMSGSGFRTVAHTAGFYPEWIFLGGYSGSGTDEGGLQVPVVRGEIAPPIRLGPGPRLLPTQARPWYGPLAGRVVGSTTVASLLTPAEAFYASVLVLASGIQAAGPNLTPETFAAGLMSTQFSNPNAGLPPYWQPSAGFGPGDHSFYDDYNVAWWSKDAPALDDSAQPTGSWCYLHQAARFTPGAYPADADTKLFNPSAGCR